MSGSSFLLLELAGQERDLDRLDPVRPVRPRLEEPRDLGEPTAFVQVADIAPLVPGPMPGDGDHESLLAGPPVVLDPVALPGRAPADPTRFGLAHLLPPPRLRHGDSSFRGPDRPGRAGRADGDGAGGSVDARVPIAEDGFTAFLVAALEVLFGHRLFVGEDPIVVLLRAFPRR